MGEMPGIPVPVFRLQLETELYIVAWNASSAMRRRKELQNYLETHKIDVCLVSETKFAPHRHFEPIPGYTHYSANFPGGSVRGGAAIFISDRICHREEATIIQEEMFQVAAVEVTTHLGPIYVAAIYCPPKEPITLANFMSVFEALGDRFVIGGDWNAKHEIWGATEGQQLPRKRGKELAMAIDESGCNCMSSKQPTTRTYPPDCVDFFITKGIAPSLMVPSMTEELSSNHNPVHLEIFLEPTSFAHFINKGRNWKKFKDILTDKVAECNPISSPEELEREYDILVESINDAFTRSHILKKGPELSAKILELQTDVQKLIRCLRRAKRVWSQSGSSADEETFNSLKGQLIMKQNQIRDEWLLECLQVQNQGSNFKDEELLWKTIKLLEKLIVPSCPLKSGDAVCARTSAEKAEVFSQHLNKVSLPNAEDWLEDKDQEVLEPEPVSDVTAIEVKKIIRNNPGEGKEPGPDGITIQILKELPLNAMKKLTSIFNAVLKLEHIPSAWKLSEVTMTPKEGEPVEEVSSYRQTFLFPCISELFESLYVKRLVATVSTLPFPGHQNLFQQEFSKTEQVHKIVSEIKEALDEKEILSAASLDISRAFDKVRYKGIINKLRKFLPSNHVNLLSSFLIGRNFRVRYEDAYSELRTLTAGVLKENILGSTLLKLYTSDIPVVDDVLLVSCSNSAVILARNDTVRTADQKLQETLDQLLVWAKKWRIQLSAQNLVHSIFTTKMVDHGSVEWEGKTIPYSDNPEYLGMTFSRRLKWKAHLEKVLSELNCKFEEMSWLFKEKSQLRTSEKVLLYKQVLRPVWFYGCQFWGDTASNCDSIQRFQNKVLRTIKNVPSNVSMEPIHKELDVVLVKYVVAKFCNTA